MGQRLHAKPGMLPANTHSIIRCKRRTLAATGSLADDFAKTKSARPKQSVAEAQLALQLIEGQADLVCIVAKMQRNPITDCERQTRAVT
jgi:hypothetical protein